MERDILLLLNLIKEKTGREVSVYSEFDDKFVSTSSEPPVRAEYKVSGVVQDEKRGKTYFRFINGSETLIGYIDGSGEAEKLVVGLIVALLENGVIKGSKEITTNTLKSILIGEEKSESIKKYVKKYKIPEKPCMVFAIFVSEEKTSDVMTFAENFKSDERDLVISAEEGVVAYVKFSEDGAEDEQTTAEYARLINSSLFEELGVKSKIGVGSKVGGFEECAISYRQAVSAVGMGRIFAENNSVFTYKEYVLIRIFEDIPKFRLEEFLSVLLDPDAKEIFEDEDMITTAEEFFNNNLNVSETSRKLYMHRNTLMYRLDKIEKTTGLDVRKFQDAVTFKIMNILYKLSERKGK